MCIDKIVKEFPGKKTEGIVFRCSKKFKKLIEDEAERRGFNKGEYIRTVLIESIQKQQKNN